MPENNLDILLTSMNPSLNNEEFVFCTVSDDDFQSLKLAPLCTFREKEGLTLIIEKSVADKAQLQYSGSWSLITCEINSDLAAVGFMAAISNALAAAGIPCNPVSAYFHDHLFVPKEKAQQSMSILREISAQVNNHS